MVNVRLIAHTGLDAYLNMIRFSDHVLGRSVSNGVEEKSKQLTDLAKFCSVLHEVRDSSGKYPENQYCLDHIFLTFAVEAPRAALLDVLLHISIGRLFVISEQQMSYLVISGTLKSWQDLTLQSHDSINMREICNQTFEYLRRLGFYDLFKNYGKHESEDGTFTLVKL